MHQYNKWPPRYSHSPADVAIPTGIPIVYKFDKEMKAIPPPKEDFAVSQVHMNALFLEKPGILKEALKREKEWSDAVPGYNRTMSRYSRPMSAIERSLYKLDAERELGQWASELIDTNAPVEDDGNDGNFGRPMQLTETEVWEMGMKELETGKQFDPDTPTFHQTAELEMAEIEDLIEDMKEEIIEPNIYTPPCVTSIPSGAVLGNTGMSYVRRDSVIVIIRHGKTQHNKLGLFTGWVRLPKVSIVIDEIGSKTHFGLLYRRMHHLRMRESKRPKRQEGY